MSYRSNKTNDGSLSDTQTYAEVKPEYGSYALWLKHNNNGANRGSTGDPMVNANMSNNTNNGIANDKTRTDPTTYVQSPRLNRSNSIRLVLNIFLSYLFLFKCLFVDPPNRIKYILHCMVVAWMPKLNHFIAYL